MKKFNLVLMFLGVAMLAAGCGGSSSSAPGVVGKVTLTPLNAQSVAKGGMTSSQTTAKTGSGGASVVGVVAQPGAPRKSVKDIAIAQLKRFEGLKLPAAPAGVVGVSASLSQITFGCGVNAGTSQPIIPASANGPGTTTLVSTSGTMAIDLVDTNNSGAFDNGDIASVTFAACVDQTTTMDGVFSLTINSQTGGVLNATSGMMEGTSGSVLVESVTMSFSGFTIVDTAPNPAEAIAMSGGFTLSITDDGITMASTMSGTSFAMTSTIAGVADTFTLKAPASASVFSIVVSEDSPTAASPAGNYSFSINMTTNIASLGEVDITTTNSFTGTGTGEPTAGTMVITGADGGTLTLTAQGDGVTVAMSLDTDGAAGPATTQILPNTDWTSI